jgi:PAB1-binding protein PBP1
VDDRPNAESHCNDMCDVSIHRACICADVAITLQICKYPDKTKARISRLSSGEAARANVPFSRTGSTTENGASARSTSRQNNQQQRSLQTPTSFGAQKRRSDAEGDGRPVTKKPKAAHMQMLGRLRLVFVFAET